MATKKPWVVLTLLGTDDVPLPPLDVTWTRHQVVQDYFWEKVRQAPIDAEVTFECRGSDGGVQNFQTLFRDNNEGHRISLPPKCVIRMRVERSELPFKMVRFDQRCVTSRDGRTVLWLRMACRSFWRMWVC